MRKSNKVNHQVHSTRETETRDFNPVHEDEDTPWVRGASLAMPPALPGMDQRWIAFKVNGADTPTNYMRKRREGWEPRPAETVPADFPVPTINHGEHAGCIVVEGMVLCHRKKAISDRRAKHFRNETDRRTQAIDSELESFNRQNRNPAFGPIRKAIGDRKVLREVSVMSDETED